jgi:hypothetical protein
MMEGRVAASYSVPARGVTLVITIDACADSAHARRMGNVLHPPHARRKNATIPASNSDGYTQDVRGRTVVDRSERTVRMREIRTCGLLGSR